MDKAKAIEAFLEPSAYPSPYQIPEILWYLVQEYLEEKYGVVMVRAYPRSAVDRPTITWRILSRTPGGGKEGTAQAKGFNWTRIEAVDSSGKAHELYMQQHRVVYEFAVFAPTAAVADEVAWDLEQTILDVVGELQTVMPAFHMVFEQQTGDTTLLWARQDELNVRVLRFLANVPIKRIVQTPVLKSIRQKISLGRFTDWRVFVRTSSSDTFRIPLRDNQRVVRIIFVATYQNGYLKPLVDGTDYVSEVDEETRDVYIRWLDDAGATPQVGESFRVDYEFAPRVAEKLIVEE